MTVEFINNFCEKHGLEFQAYPNTIFIIRKARNEKLPGDLPTRNIEVFDIRLKENDWEIWWEFLDMVEAEYDRLTKCSGYTFTFNTTSSYLNNKGRVVKQDNLSQLLTYTVTISGNGKTETIELGSILEGIYTK